MTTGPKRPEGMPLEQWGALYAPYRKTYKLYHDATAKNLTHKTIDKNRVRLAREQDALETFLQSWIRQRQVSERLDEAAALAAAQGATQARAHDATQNAVASLAAQAQRQHEQTQSLLELLLQRLAPDAMPLPAPPELVISDDICVYCQECMGETFDLECGHRFHKACVLASAVAQKTEHRCPVCRRIAAEAEQASIKLFIKQLWDARKGPAAREFVLLRPPPHFHRMNEDDFHRVWMGAMDLDPWGTVVLGSGMSLTEISCRGDEIHSFVDEKMNGRWPNHGQPVYVVQKNGTIIGGASFECFVNSTSGAEARLTFQDSMLPPLPSILLADIQRFTLIKDSWNAGSQHLYICSPEGSVLRAVDFVGQRGVFVAASGFRGVPMGIFTLQAVEEDAPVVPRLVLRSSSGVDSKVPINACVGIFPEWMDPPPHAPGRDVPLGSPVHVRIIGRPESITGVLIGYSRRPSELVHIISVCDHGGEELLSLELRDVIYIERA